MDLNVVKTEPARTTTLPPPPPTYDEAQAQGVYPGSLLYTDDGRHGQQPQLFVPVYLIESYPPLGPSPVQTVCHTCHHQIITSTRESPANEAYLCCMLASLLGCIMCSCLPFFLDSFQKIDHFCPSCESYIGTYRP